VISAGLTVGLAFPERPKWGGCCNLQRQDISTPAANVVFMTLADGPESMSHGWDLRVCHHQPNARQTHFHLSHLVHSPGATTLLTTQEGAQLEPAGQRGFGEYLGLFSAIMNSVSLTEE
jgi:hypothetical protein